MLIGAGWQSGYAADCKSAYSGSIPLPASKWGPRPAGALIPGSSVVEQAAVNRWVDGSNPSRGASESGGLGDTILTPLIPENGWGQQLGQHRTGFMKMPKAPKTRSELAEMMMAQARQTGKCDGLDRVLINGPHPGGPSNWDFEIYRSGPTRSGPTPVCRHELRLIAGRLQALFDLSGD